MIKHTQKYSQYHLIYALYLILDMKQTRGNTSGQNCQLPYTSHHSHHFFLPKGQLLEGLAALKKWTSPDWESIERDITQRFQTLHKELKLVEAQVKAYLQKLKFQASLLVESHARSDEYLLAAADSILEKRIQQVKCQQIYRLNEAVNSRMEPSCQSLEFIHSKGMEAAVTQIEKSTRKIFRSFKTAYEAERTQEIAARICLKSSIVPASPEKMKLSPKLEESQIKQKGPQKNQVVSYDVNEHFPKLGQNLQGKKINKDPITPTNLQVDIESDLSSTNPWIKIEQFLKFPNFTPFNMVVKVASNPFTIVIQNTEHVQIKCFDSTGQGIFVIKSEPFIQLGCVISITNCKKFLFSPKKQDFCFWQVQTTPDSVITEEKIKIQKEGSANMSRKMSKRSKQEYFEEESEEESEEEDEEEYEEVRPLRNQKKVKQTQFKDLKLKGKYNKLIGQVIFVGTTEKGKTRCEIGDSTGYIKLLLPRQVQQGDVLEIRNATVEAEDKHPILNACGSDCDVEEIKGVTFNVYTSNNLSSATIKTHVIE